MLQNYTIKCYTEDGGIFKPIEESKIELENHNEGQKRIYVHCGPPEMELPIKRESFDNNSFEFTYYGDNGIVINRNRCELDLYFKPNLSFFDKYYNIVITHSQDVDVYEEIEIHQPSENFTIDLDSNNDLSVEYVKKGEILKTINEQQYDSIQDESEKEEYDKRYILELNSIIMNKSNDELSNSNYNFYEEKEINVNVQGGSKTYEIKSLLRYYIIKDEEDEIEETNTTIKTSRFDNGFIYTLFNDENIGTKKFVIKNYGKPFMEEEDFYELVLCHKDTKDLYIRLKVIYKKPPQSHHNPSHIIIEKEPQIPQLSDIYFPKTVSQLDEDDIEEYGGVRAYEIVFLDDIEEELVVLDNPQRLVFPFKVTFNGRSCKLKVNAYSTGNWCSVKTDDTNRNLIITIKNKPLCERKSLIKVEIIDYPDVTKSFIILNKPR